MSGYPLAMVDDSYVIELMRSVFHGLRKTKDGLRRTDEEFARRRTLPTDPGPLIGAGRPGTPISRADLVGTPHESIGQTEEAIATLEQLVMDRAHTLGVEHPFTLADRAKLGSAYQNRGRISEAIAVYESLLADRERVFGIEHPDVLLSRDELAGAYCAAGRGHDAIAILAPLLTDRVRIYGAEHARTRVTRANLAAAYQDGGLEGDLSATHGAAETSRVTVQDADGREFTTAEALAVADAELGRGVAVNAVVTAVQFGLAPRLIAIATRRGLPTVKGDGSALESLRINDDLLGDGAYSESEHAQVQSWLKLLNELANSEGSASLSDARAAAVIAAVRVFLEDHSARR